MQDDSVADRTSFSDHPFRTQSPNSANPFEKINKNNLLGGGATHEGPGRVADAAIGNNKINNTSQSLFSNQGREVLLAGERALTEFGSNFDARRESLTSEFSMNTHQNCAALETQLQKYEGDIRKHISIEHQLQLFAEDLKRTVTQLEKEKE